MRNRLTILGFALLTVLVLAAGACGGTKSNRQCADEQLVCVRGSWEVMCEKFVRGDAEVVPMECCTFGEDAGKATAKGDAGFLPAIDASTGWAGKDAGRAGRDAAHGKYPPLGDCGDGGWPYDMDAGYFYSLFDAHVIAPEGLDDGGGVHVWQCYIDVCNPPHWSWDGGIVYDGGGMWWLLPRDGSVANCGPLGCP
ncbi:MAG TPA: hypothetical protein VGK67_27105 [Myxococcales bacterium]|jgi:hypothetical protein